MVESEAEGGLKRNRKCIFVGETENISYETKFVVRVWSEAFSGNYPTSGLGRHRGLLA